VKRPALPFVRAAWAFVRYAIGPGGSHMTRDTRDTKPMRLRS
jgi:hypothetical protein